MRGTGFEKEWAIGAGQRNGAGERAAPARTAGSMSRRLRAAIQAGARSRAALSAVRQGTECGSRRLPTGPAPMHRRRYVGGAKVAIIV